MSNKEKVTNWIREDTKRNTDASMAGLISVASRICPTSEGPASPGGSRTEEIAQFRDAQLAISIPVGHLEFGLEKAQQLSLADRAGVVIAGDLSRVVGHG